MRFRPASETTRSGKRGVRRCAPGPSPFREAAVARITFDSTIPVLRIFSVEKARAFYVDYLGFAVDWEHRF